MSVQNFDMIVIGAGPGGYVSAIRAAQLGLNVAIIEANHLGGICLNWGCIPTKALLRSAELYHLMQRSAQFGINADNISFDFDKIIARSRGVAHKLSHGVSHLLKKNKVTVIDGWAKIQGYIKDSWHINVESDGKKNHNVTASHVVIAAGARARSLPGIEDRAQHIWTYREAMVPDKCPKSVLVIGSGAIGIEFASFYRQLGAKVTVIEMLDRILPAEDIEISSLARKAFEKQGMHIITQAQLLKLETTANSVTACLKVADREQTVEAEKVISAIGIIGNIENLGLENTKVKIDKHHIVVNEWCETGEPHLYAIGDIAGAPWLAHKASHEGVMVAERIAGLNNGHPIKLANIPGCTYSSPQIASVGYTEQRARDLGHAVKVGRFPFMANGKAIAQGESEGLVKTIFDQKTGELLGAHMIGAEVTEMIQGYVIAKTAELTEHDLIHTVFAHPTLSEMMHESVLDAYGHALHI